MTEGRDKDELIENLSESIKDYVAENPEYGWIESVMGLTACICSLLASSGLPKKELNALEKTISLALKASYEKSN